MEALWTFMEDMITFKCLFEGNGVMILKNYSHKLRFGNKNKIHKYNPGFS